VSPFRTNEPTRKRRTTITFVRFVESATNPRGMLNGDRARLRGKVLWWWVMVVGLGLVGADSGPFPAIPAPELNPPPSAAASYSGHPRAWREVLVGHASLRAKTPRRVRVCECARTRRLSMCAASHACAKGRGELCGFQVEVRALKCVPPVTDAGTALEADKGTCGRRRRGGSASCRR